MSQAGEIDVVGNNPDIPTSFVTDDGVAVPIANVLEILGTAVVAGTTPVETTGSGNTVTIEVQRSQTSALSDASKVGLAVFDSAGFAVDANGFVTLLGGGSGITNVNVDANTAPGTDPVVPVMGAITVTGGQVATGVIGTNVIRTNSLAANTFTIQIQRSTAVAATDITKNGVSHFNSTEFSVDANGFVSLAGGGIAIDSIGTQTGTNPISPTAGGLVTINGAVVAAGTNPVRTDGTGANTMAVEVQISQALAATDATKIGLSNFDSAAFDVDANGFVQLNGGGIATTAFDVQANTAPGTDPVVPSAAGVVVVNGAAVANHSVVLETRSRAANAYNLEVQYATSAAATDATKSGVAHFNSTQFSVDANGFVALAGGGLAIDSIGTQTGTNPITPTAGGLVTINGAVVAAGTNPVRSDGTGANTMAIEVQISQALAATDATKIGLSNFNSSHFSVDANGFVSLSGGGQAIDSIHPDSGTDPVVPTSAGLVNIIGSGSTTTVGSLNTLTIQLTGLTNHAVLVGAGTTTITKVGPTATAGQVLQSAGSSADPVFSTATYPSTTTANQLLYSSSANVVAGLTAGNSLVAATNASGTMAMRSFSVVLQKFDTTGTYTPTTGMLYCIIEAVGGGGAGGGCAVCSAAQYAGAAGGGSGEYAFGIFSASDIGASKAVTIGAAGAKAAAGNNPGGAGGTTSVGATLLSAGGGGGGGGCPASTLLTGIFPGNGGSGGTVATNGYNYNGWAGNYGLNLNASNLLVGGTGGNSVFGAGGAAASNNNGNNATGFGAGGGGSSRTNGAASQGGDGTKGFVKVTEFVIN